MKLLISFFKNQFGPLNHFKMTKTLRRWEPNKKVWDTHILHTVKLTEKRSTASLKQNCTPTELYGTQKGNYQIGPKYRRTIDWIQNKYFTINSSAV